MRLRCSALHIATSESFLIFVYPAVSDPTDQNAP